MDLLVIFGYVAAILIGLSLGLTGAGGSILTVPILVYLIGIDPIQSTAYSLFVVGSVASFGAFSSYQKKEVNITAALYFGVPSVVIIFFTRKFFIPALPDILLHLNGWPLYRDVAILVLFAALMIMASVKMIKRSIIKTGEIEVQGDNLLLIFQGSVVGFITGLVGAGGGFLIIPALVLIAKLPMKKAIGTSLLIVCCNAFIGFIGDLTERNIDWIFLIPFTILAVIGILLGIRLKGQINGAKLKRGFGYFILVTAIWIIISELSLFS